MGAWRVFVEVSLPPPIILLTLLVLPSPARLGRSKAVSIFFFSSALVLDLLTSFRFQNKTKQKIDRSFTRLVLRVVDRTLGLPVLGTLQLLHVMIALAGAAAVGSVRDAAAAAKHKGGLELSLSASAAASYAAKRWRAERNAWIAAFALAAWCLLARVYSMARRLADLEDEREARLAAAPATAFRAAAASASAKEKGKAAAVTATTKAGFEAGTSTPSAPPLTRANSSGAGKKKQ